jgi:two-component system, OmpR family, sensor histidine kinase KdpD
MPRSDALPAAVPPRASGRWHGALVALLIWLATAGLMALLDGQVDLINLTMLLMLGSALSALWVTLPLTLLGSALAMLVFNWAMVPPRGSLSIELHQHLVLLGVIFGVNLIIAVLMARLRDQAADAREQARRSAQLRRWGDHLRDATDPALLVTELHQQLQLHGCGAPCSLILDSDAHTFSSWGDPDADSREGLKLCLRQSRAMGPGTGWHDSQPAWFLPWRAGATSLGATRVPLPSALYADDALRDQMQLLCDRLGSALARQRALLLAHQAQVQTQSQSTRNTLLAAISHDYRTPLATILGAASSLLEHDAQLGPEQRRRLALTIQDQTRLLGSMTDNTLQLARLSSPGVTLPLDWESAEDIVGAALNRVRLRDKGHRVSARLAPGLPLLRCDAVLLAQLLDNLLDNALRHTPSDSPVELRVCRQFEHLVLAVRDRGPGVPSAQRQRIFDVFQRGEGHSGEGAGVGLAVCRAIAQAHGGELRLRPRARGGASFECWLPLSAPPAAPAGEVA